MTHQLVQILATGAAEDEGVLVALCVANGAQGVEVQNTQTHNLADNIIRVAAWYGTMTAAEKVRQHLVSSFGSRISIQVVEAQIDGWADTLLDETPVAVGNQFSILPHVPETRVRTAIYIRRGLGFGQGTHPTTRLCVLAIEALFEREPFLRRFADLGTGTGILAMIAARLGAHHVIATEIDSVAYEGAQHHIDHNELTDHVELHQTLPPLQAPLDCVMANLPAPELLEVWRTAEPYLRAGGYAVLSGFSPMQFVELETQLSRDGLMIVRTYTEGPWCAILAYRAN